jgi:twinkle protein
MIDQNIIDEIKLKATVTEVIGDFIKLKKNGVNYIGSCPFHDEKTASFTVSPVKNIYKCFGCGKSGDAITFVMEHRKWSYPEAIRFLADKYRVQIPEVTAAKKTFVTPTPRLEKMEKSTIEYFEKYRKISNNTLLRFRVTDSMEWMPKAKSEVLAINFNYYDGETLVNIKYRAKDKDFKLFKDAKLIFYNLDSIKGQEWAVITEGEIDAMTMYECDIYNVVSVPNGAGAGKLNLEYLDNCYDSFSGVKKIIIATDGDTAGEGLRYELARRLGLERCFKIEYPLEKVVKDAKTGEMRACKDPNEVLIHLGEDRVKYMVDTAKEWPVEGVLTCEDLQDDIIRFWEDGFPMGIELGIPGLDELIKFQDGQFTTITGIPGMGKSEFLDYMLSKAAKRYGIKSAMVSFENQPSSVHATKLMQKVAGKSFAFRSNPSDRMTQDDFEQSLLLVNDHFFFLNLSENEITIDYILIKLMELVKRKGIKMWVIDPWNYIEMNKPPGVTETDHVSQVLTKIKRFCMISGTHGFLIAHPTKMKKENGKFEIPNLYSISGSAHFYNKTDNGMCVHIDERVIIYVQKVRFDWNGIKGYCEFNFNKETRQYQPIGVLPSVTFSNNPPPLKEENLDF